VPPLPVISGDEFVGAVEKLGYKRDRTRGSHMILRCAGRKQLSVPRHRNLDRGLLRGLIRDAGISVEELVELLA
jgi:predicted RNA binding protein YcfA (HicA-like mRNA interferase family)